MNTIGTLWGSLGRGMRIVALGGAVFVLALAGWGAFMALHKEYKVLFADLAAGDAAAVVERLKADKVPYRLSNGGSTVSVPAEQVHDVRLSLMSGDLPLAGGVGFEIFDKQGLGATEHSQKVSFQRALQGELARTISSLDNVRNVRVHLVLPESTLFTRDRQAASAAVTVAMRPGTRLERQQIIGVQRLVAAAVAGLDPMRVVVTDHRGVTLSSSDAAGSGGAAEARLQVKREIEDYVTQKVARLLDSAVGAGRAIVSVDASLNFDATKTTIQDLLPAGSGPQAAEGRVVRRRQVTGAGTVEPLWTRASATAGDTPAMTPSSSTEIEYQFGRRIDEIIAAPGAVTRMSIGIVVPDEIGEERRQQIVELVRMAAGLNEERGDAVSVQALHQAEATVMASNDPMLDEAVEAQRDPPAPERARSAPRPAWWTWAVAGVALVLLVSTLVRVRPRRLSDRDRQRLLEDVQRALATDGAAAASRSLR